MIELAEGLNLLSGAIQSLIIIAGAIIFLVARYKKPDELSEDFNELREKHNADMKEIRDEIKHSNELTQNNIKLMRDDIKDCISDINSELCQVSYENGAMLDGLIQMGCNGEVTKAKETHDKRLNKQAHNIQN